MPQIVIGIDIGVTGAIAVISRLGLLGIRDMPIVTSGKGGASVKNRLNPAGLADIMREVLHGANVEPKDAMTVFEHVSAMPGQGSAAGFSLGDSSGVVRAVAATLMIPAQIITAATWKKHFSIGATGPARAKPKELFTDEEKKQRERERQAAKGLAKQQARALVIQLYPGISASLARKADHNRAEAVLIARYGWERLT